MKEWSDEELDKLFRKSAGEFEPPFEPDDWKELRHRLDDADQVAGGGWMEQARPWTIALLLLMITGGISVYYGSSKMGEKRDTILSASDKYPPGSSAQNKSVPGRPSTSGTEKGTGPETALSESRESTGKEFTEHTTQAIRHRETPDSHHQTDQYKDIKELPRSLANVSGVRKQTDLRNREGGEGAILLPKEKSTADSRSKKVLPGNDQTQVAPRTSTTARGQETDRQAMDSGTILREQASRPDSLSPWAQIPVLERLSNRPITQVPPSWSTPVVGHHPADGQASPPTHTAARVPQWAIRIGISPDLSFVNMNMQSLVRPGPAASMLIEHSLSQRWSIQAGVIRSLKIYNARAGAYEWPASWYQKQMPVSVDGSCQVFELPLNVRYDFSQLPKGRWFAGAGLSSYKMQKEKYVYHYKTYDPTIRWWKWEGQTGWYLFSHANASVGYERLLTKRLSIMAEPYIRVPLRGVGFGKVNLFSTGVWFSLRYAPVLRK